VDASGKPLHNEWTGKFDGKDYPVTGDSTQDARAYRKIDDRTMELTYKLNGKTTETDRWELSADGKTLTDTVNYPGVDKQEVDVFERQ